MNEDHTFDAEAFKFATRAQWDAAASGWDHHGPLIRAWLRDATQAMIDMANVGPGSRVLDVAAGAGDQTRDIAERVGPDGYVLATDMSPAILALALSNARQAGFENVEARVADCEMLDVNGETFDAGVSRLGLMFLPDPLRGLRAIRSALKPGGAFCAMVFSSPAANPCIATLIQTALSHAGLPPRDPLAPGGLFSLGKSGLLDELFKQAGFGDVATTRMAAPFRLNSVDAYLDFIRSSASPIQSILSGLEDTAKHAAWSDMREKLSIYSSEHAWEGPNELLLTAGKA